MRAVAAVVRLGFLASVLLACGAGPTPVAAAPPPVPSADAAPVERIDTRRDGVYRAGRWEYRFRIVAPGSKSQGYDGVLLFDGKPVEEPDLVGDYYRTPWGDLQWAGRPQLLWEDHGWMPRDPGVTGGHQLVEPWSSAGAPIVMALMLEAGGTAPEAGPGVPGGGSGVDPWVRDALAAAGVRAFHVARPWFPVTDQALTLEDTKAYGTLTVRQAQARSDATLEVILDGTAPERVILPRKDGATRLVAHTAGGGVIEPRTVYLALRVERAAPAWAAPFDIGPEADGKEVVSRGAHELVIALPGDRDSGNVWVVKAVRGDSPVGGPIREQGPAQFVPAVAPGPAPAWAPGRPGTFELAFRVVALGTADVELELRRPWQGADGPVAKTFRVTVRIEELPTPLRWPGDGK